MAHTLSLQDLEPPVEVQTGLYRSANSVFACVVVSTFSVVCPT